MIATEPVTRDRHVGADYVARRASVTTRTVRYWDSIGLLPRPTKIGGRTKRWSEREIENWFAAGCPHRTEWEQIREERMSGGLGVC